MKTLLISIPKWILISLLFGNAFPTELKINNNRDAILRFKIKHNTNATKIKITKGRKIYFSDLVHSDSPFFEVQLPTGIYKITVENGHLSPEEIFINVKDNIYIADGKPVYSRPIELTLIQNALINGKIYAPEYITETITDIQLGDLWAKDERIKVSNGSLYGKLKPGKYKVETAMLLGRQANVSISPSTVELVQGKNWLTFYIEPAHDKAKVEVENSDEWNEWHLIKISAKNKRLEDLLTPPESVGYGDYIIEGDKEGKIYRTQTKILPFRYNIIELDRQEFEKLDALFSAQKIFSHSDGGSYVEYSKTLPVLIGNKTYEIKFDIHSNYKENSIFNFYINGKKHEVFSFSLDEIKSKAEVGEPTGRIGCNYSRTDRFKTTKTIYDYPFKLEAFLGRYITYETRGQDDLSSVSFELYQLHKK